jgi:acyl-CoA thioesterase-2
VIQHGKPIFSMDASFQVEEEGLSHQADMPDLAPPPESAITDAMRRDRFITYLNEYKLVMENQPLPPFQHSWFKANGEISSDDRLLHAALLTYQSDDALLSTSRLPHRGTFERKDLQSASLDHAMWFHAPARVDQWLLYALDAPQASASRGYNRGLMYTVDGKLVASTVQESLMRWHGNEKQAEEAS